MKQQKIDMVIDGINYLLGEQMRTNELLESIENILKRIREK